MHASNGLLHDIGVGLVTLEVPIKTQPVHLAAIHDLLASYDRNVVFTLTGNNTSTATNALPKINRHPPLRNSDPVLLVLLLQLR